MAHPGRHGRTARAAGGRHGLAGMALAPPAAACAVPRGAPADDPRDRRRLRPCRRHVGPAVDVDRGPPERPALAFRLAEADPAPEAAEVDVVGDLRRRKVAVVETACGILWPAGKLISPYRTVLRALPRRTDAASEPAAPPEPPPVLLPVPTMGGLPPLPRASSTRRGDRSRSRSARRPHSCPSQSSSPCRSSSRTSSSPAQQLRCPGDLGTGGSLASQRGVPVRLPAAFERGPIDLTNRRAAVRVRRRRRPLRRTAARLPLQHRAPPPRRPGGHRRQRRRVHPNRRPRDRVAVIRGSRAYVIAIDDPRAVGLPATSSTSSCPRPADAPKASRRRA